MKTAISLPDEIFRKAESVARRLRISRSELYARALETYLFEMRSAEITEALDALYTEEDSKLGHRIARMQAASIPGEEW